MAAFQLADVYGVSRGIPKTYTERPGVDHKLRSSLKRDKHVVVYGGSKQGRTCLRKHLIPEGDCVIVQCGGGRSRAQLYEMILKEAGASVSVTETKAISGSMKVNVVFKGSVGVPIISKAEASAGTDLARERNTTIETEKFQIDPSDPNDVIRVLAGVSFSKYIVLEDFHYLTEEVQKEISIDLKAFHEKSNISVIIIGVWLESNRLVLYNGDLAGRLIPVDADQWTDSQLESVISSGEPLMNVSFSKDVKSQLIVSCQSNVGLLQEACYLLLESQGITSTSDVLFEVSNVVAVQQIMRNLAAERASRYKNFLVRFVEGFRETDLEMWRWIAAVVVTTPPEQLKRGLKFQQIFNRLNDIHPKRKGNLHANNVFQAIRNIKILQQTQRVTPIIFDYDSNENLLQVVDAGFILYVASTDQEELLKMVATRHALDPQLSFIDLLESPISGDTSSKEVTSKMQE